MAAPIASAWTTAISNYTRRHSLFRLNSSTTNLQSSKAKETAALPINVNDTIYPAGTRMRDYEHLGSDNVLHLSNDTELMPDLWLTRIK